MPRLFFVFFLILSSSVLAHPVVKDTSSDPQAGLAVQRPLKMENLVYSQEEAAHFLRSRRIGRGAFIDESNSLARDWISVAIDHNKNNSWGTIFRKVLNALSHSTTHYFEDDDSTYVGCKDGPILAFTQPELGDFRNIYFCEWLWEQDPDERYAAQTLIHESTHLTGVINECRTTEIEINAMYAAGQELAYENGYMDQCGLEPLD